MTSVLKRGREAPAARASPLTKLALAVCVVAGGLAATGVRALTISYDFNLPATGLESVNPPYPSVATLTITDIAGGVMMTLDPNETSSGFNQGRDRLGLVHRTPHDRLRPGGYSARLASHTARKQ